MDYFNYNRRRGNSVTQDRLNAPLPPGGRPLPSRGSREPLARLPSSIRIRRLPSTNAPRRLSQASDSSGDREDADHEVSGLRRSSSAPQRATGVSSVAPSETDLQRQTTVEPYMATITEGAQMATRESRMGQRAQTPTTLHPGSHAQVETPQLETPMTPSINIATPSGDPVERVATGASAMHSAGNAARANRGLRRYRSTALLPSRDEEAITHSQQEYDSDVIDLLNLVDPEVSTLETLTNVQNSLFVPDLGRWLNRRPTYDLTPLETGATTAEEVENINHKARSRAATHTGQRPRSRAGTLEKLDERLSEAQNTEDLDAQRPSSRMSITSVLTESYYAVLPHGVNLEGWSNEDLAELNDHVRHQMHSKRAGFRRSMRGFRKYVSKPLGLFVTVYAILVTLFGAAWVFFLIGWLSVGQKQDYVVNVIDNVLVALFALIGDGLAPFRAVDTYHMCFIAHYHYLTWRLRREKQMPELADRNDLPGRRASAVDIETSSALDVEAGETKDDIDDRAFVSVLSPRQQRRLQYHQTKFNKSHTFYRPHETATHHAFPLKLLIAVVVLLDCHSLFQVALGTCTWSIDYHVRPQALTATILSCSISCNILGGVLVSIGDRRTRKKDVVERIFRQDLTKRAIKNIQKKHTEQNHQGIGVNLNDDMQGHHVREQHMHGLMHGQDHHDHHGQQQAQAP